MKCIYCDLEVDLLLVWQVTTEAFAQIQQTLEQKLEVQYEEVVGDCCSIIQSQHNFTIRSSGDITALSALILTHCRFLCRRWQPRFITISLVLFLLLTFGTDPYSTGLTLPKCLRCHLPQPAQLSSQILIKIVCVS